MFLEYSQKLEEEEKRLFYVAVTRARDALFLSGILEKDQPQKLSWLKWLWETLDIRNSSGKYTFGDGTPELQLGKSKVPTIIIRSQSEIEALSVQPSSVSRQLLASGPRPVHIELPPEPPQLHVEPVTKYTRRDLKRHKVTEQEDPIAFGVVMHRTLEAIANAELRAEDRTGIIALARREFASEGLRDELSATHCEEIAGQIDELRRHGLLKIALPQPNSYAELPFMLRQGEKIYSGRIDRLIVHPDTVDVYDYKTFPTQENELPELAAEYANQMSIYLEAAAQLFPGKQPRGFLVFTALPRLLPLSLRSEV